MLDNVFNLCHLPLEKSISTFTFQVCLRYSLIIFPWSKGLHINSSGLKTILYNLLFDPTGIFLSRSNMWAFPPFIQSFLFFCNATCLLPSPHICDLKYVHLFWQCSVNQHNHSDSIVQNLHYYKISMHVVVSDVMF